MSSQRELFGGAITVTLPTILIDASDLRQIPDTQEVFLHPANGVSIIVEILQSVDPTDPQQAAKFHFDALAHDNSAVSSEIKDTTTSVSRQSEISSSVLLSGAQFVSKFNKGTPDEVQIFLALYRIPSKHVDLVMTMNVPTKAADGEAVDVTQLAEAKATFDVAAQSLFIVNFGLFV